MTAVTDSRTAATLRPLYVVRAAFAVVWAVVAMATSGPELTPFTVALFVLYPLADAAAAVRDLRSSRSPLLYLNIAVSLLAAAGVGVAAASGVPAVLRVWAAWAIAAGLIQLIVALTRRAMGGQLPMIISGGLSVLAGGYFLSRAGTDAPTLFEAAGYALPGAVFFLLSALRLGRTDTGRAGVLH